MSELTEFEELDPAEVHLVKRGANGFPPLLAKAPADAARYEAERPGKGASSGKPANHTSAHIHDQPGAYLDAAGHYRGPAKWTRHKGKYLSQPQSDKLIELITTGRAVNDIGFDELGPADGFEPPAEKAAVPTGVAEISAYGRWVKDRRRRGRGIEGFNFEHLLDDEVDRLVTAAHDTEPVVFSKAVARAAHVERFRAEVTRQATEKASAKAEKKAAKRELRKQVREAKRWERAYDRREGRAARQAVEAEARRVAVLKATAEAVTEALDPGRLDSVLAGIRSRLDAVVETVEARKGALIATRPGPRAFDPDHVDHPAAADLAEMLSVQRAGVRVDLDQPPAPQMTAPRSQTFGPVPPGGIDDEEAGVTTWS